MGDVLFFRPRSLGRRGHSGEQHASLLDRQTAPEVQEGEFVKVFDDLAAAWAAWAKKINRNPKVISDSIKGGSPRIIVPVFDSGQERPRYTHGLGNDGLP